MKNERTHSKYQAITDDSLNASLNSVAPTGYDQLTGLAGIGCFKNTAQKILEEIFTNEDTAVMVYFDLAGMKVFNISFGFDEGDRLIQAFANILIATFDREHCCRLGSDHFVIVSNAESIESRLKNVFEKLECVNSGKTLKVSAGIYALSGPEENVIYASDRAKMASDVNRISYESKYTWFNEKMSADYLLKSYIISHIDQAIERGWIRVYFQPVVRTLTGKLCSFEALARWEDPTYGFLQPGQFISILENNYLSLNLDLAIARRTAQMMRQRLDSGKPVLPVSINFSRNDFAVGDPVVGIENIIKEFNLPSDFFFVEITESAVIKDSSLMRSMIERFHEVGVDVWMDDYGSGYSSLNVLKDFNFNEIKIDMVFLRNLNERSKIIINQTVQMAKKLGIHTLAEGVETKEQLEFLKQIGCEKIQGYYYSRPLSFAEFEEYMASKHMDIESREMAAFYDKAGLVEISSEKPTALFLYGKDKKFRLLYENYAYKNSIVSEQLTDAEVIEINMNMADSSLGLKFRNLAQRAIDNGGEVTMAFVDRDRYYLFSFELVVQDITTSLLLAHIDATNYDYGTSQNVLLDNTLRNILSIYDSIYLIDTMADSRTVIVIDLPNETNGETIYGLKAFYTNYQQRHIFPDDLKRFRQMMEHDFVIDKISSFNRGYYEDFFRIKNANGDYEWKDIVIIMLPESDNRQMLACIKLSSLEFQYEVDEALSHVLSTDNADKANTKHELDLSMWQSLLNQSDIKFFWKDKERRFVGVSQPFLDYFSLDSVDRIKGLTDDEVGWHANNVPYREDEINVLTKGKIIRNSYGQCIVNGVLKPIAATKFPIYSNGKIVGLIGYFVDVSDEMQNFKTNRDSSFVDAATGFMNSRGIILTLLEMDNELREQNLDYTIIVCDVPAVYLLRREYGTNISAKLIKAVAEKIRQIFSPLVSVGRLQGSKFLICYRNSEERLNTLLQKLGDEIHSIKEVLSIKCSLTANFGVAKGSETSGMQKVIDLATERMLSSNSIEKIDSIYIPDTYSDFPIAYTVIHPIIADRKVIDLEFLYANSKYCEVSGKHLKDLVGHTFKEVFPNADPQWLPATYRVAFGEVTSGRVYEAIIRHWVQFYCAPTSKPGCCSMVFTIIDEDIKTFDSLTRGRTTDDCIIKVSRTLNNEKDINVAINAALNLLGQVIVADRLCVFDIEGWIVHGTAEWCKKGVSSLMQQMRTFDYEYISYWEKILLDDTSVVVNDIGAVAVFNRRLYQYLKYVNIHNFMAAPLYNEGRLAGYIGVQNFKVDDVIDIRRLLETSSYFFADRLALSKSLNKLERLSSHDSLTDAKSRNALFEKMAELEKSSGIAGVVFADLNNLKFINDNSGHAAGDEAIRGAANLLFRFCGKKNVYRNGGDEFVALLPDVTLGTFDMVRDNISRAVGSIENAILAVGFEWCQDTRNIRDSMKKADTNMYANKAEYYKIHDRRHHN